MKCKILHESAGRIRVHAVMRRMTTDQADLLEEYLLRAEGVKKASVFERTCDVIILYSGKKEGFVLTANFDAQQGEPLNEETVKSLMKRMESYMLMIK